MFRNWNRVYHSTNQFLLPENGRKVVRLIPKMALKKWNTNFCLEYSFGKNKTTFSDVPLLPDIFRWEDLKGRVPFTFEPDFPEIFVNGKQPLLPFDVIDFAMLPARRFWWETVSLLNVM